MEFHKALVSGLYFFIYINELPISLQSSQVTMYADNTTSPHASKTIVDLSENRNKDLCNLKQWLQDNMLSLNLIKTQAMVVGSRPNLKKISDKKVQSSTFVVDDSQIEIGEKAKYLGVQLDQDLVSDEHVRYVCTKVSRALGFLKYVKKLLPQEILGHIYRGIVEPYFHYCSLMWGSYGETRLLTLQKLQNRAARIVTNSRYDGLADALIEKLNWPTISEIIKRETMTMVYKSLNGLIPMYLSNIFSRHFTRDTVYLRNSESDLRLSLLKTANGQKSFAYRGAHL